MRWCQIIFLGSKQKQKYFPGAGESHGSHSCVGAAANRSLTSGELTVRLSPKAPPCHLYLSPRRDGRRLEHPHVVWYKAHGIGRVWVSAVGFIFALLRAFWHFLHGPPVNRQHLPGALTGWFPDIICRWYICKAVAKIHAGADKMPPPCLRKMEGKLNSSAGDTKINNREEEKYFTSFFS